MVNNLTKAAALFLAGAGLLACEKGPDENLSTPSILGFYESADTVGAVVRIVATQLSKKPENNKVAFNGPEATGFALNGDTLKVRVPRGAKTGPLTLSVYEQRAVSATAFTVLAGHWKHKGVIPPNLSSVKGFAVNGKAYLYTEGNPVGFSSYDPQSNAWVRLADFPGGTRGGMLSFALGGIGYLGAGVSDNGLRTHSDCYAYNPGTNQWTRVADFPGGNLDVRYTKTFVAGGKAYTVCTSWYNSQVRPVWEYNPQTNTWTRKNDFPGETRYLAGAMGIGNKGYVGGGTTGGSPLLRDFWEYDPATDIWTRKADLPAETQSPVGFGLGSKGYWGLSYSGNFSEYDPTTNTWAPAAYFIGTNVYLGSPFTTGNKGYLVVPDISGSTLVKTDLWEFTP